MNFGDDVIDESDLDYVELEREPEVDEHAFSAGRIATVAAAGALLSLSLYYLYQQLDPEKKSRLKRRASGFIQEQIHALTEVSDED